MTNDDIIAFANSIHSFAVPTTEEVERIQALSNEDYAALLSYLLEDAAASPPATQTMDDIWKASKARAAARLAAE